MRRRLVSLLVLSVVAGSTAAAQAGVAPLARDEMVRVSPRPGSQPAVTGRFRRWEADSLVLANTIGGLQNIARANIAKIERPVSSLRSGATRGALLGFVTSGAFFAYWCSQEHNSRDPAPGLNGTCIAVGTVLGGLGAVVGGIRGANRAKARWVVIPESAWGTR